MLLSIYRFYWRNPSERFWISVACMIGCGVLIILIASSSNNLYSSFLSKLIFGLMILIGVSVALSSFVDTFPNNFLSRRFSKYKLEKDRELEKKEEEVRIGNILTKARSLEIVTEEEFLIPKLKGLIVLCADGKNPDAVEKLEKWLENYELLMSQRVCLAVENTIQLESPLKIEKIEESLTGLRALLK